MRGHHHFRYVLSLTLLAFIPEVYFLSKMTAGGVAMSFAVAFFTLFYMMPADMGFTRGGKTNPRKWVWEFNSQSIVGIRLFSLPIEEYLFVFVWIPLPIAVWEYLKNLPLSAEYKIGISIASILAAVFLYPLLSKPDK